MGERKDHYSTLGVEQDASQERIRKAFRAKAKECHPDCAGPEGEVRFKELAEAHEVLTDPSSRACYDEERRDACRAGQAAARRSSWPAEPTRARGWRGPSPRRRPGWPDEPAAEAAPRGWPSAATGWPGFPAPARPPAHDLDVTLEPFEARRGGLLPLPLRVTRACPACGGSGSAGGWPCGRCVGQGFDEIEVPLAVEIPPGVPDGAVLVLRPFDPHGPLLRLRISISRW